MEGEEACSRSEIPSLEQGKDRGQGEESEGLIHRFLWSEAFHLLDGWIIAQGRVAIGERLGSSRESCVAVGVRLPPHQEPP